MKYLIIVFFLWCNFSWACIDCGDNAPVPELEPELLFVESDTGHQVLEVEAVFDTNIDANPENVRIIKKSMAKISDTVIIKSIESVKFIIQGEGNICYAHMKKDVYYKFKFEF